MSKLACAGHSLISAVRLGSNHTNFPNWEQQIDAPWSPLLSESLLRCWWLVVWSSDTFHHAGSWWCVRTHCWVQPCQGAPSHCLHAASSTSQIPSPRGRSTQRDASLGESGSTYSVFVIFIFKLIYFLPQDTFGQDFYLRRRQCLRAKTCILYRNIFFSSLLRVFFFPSLYLTT